MTYIKCNIMVYPSHIIFMIKSLLNIDVISLGTPEVIICTRSVYGVPMFETIKKLYIVSKL